MTNVVVSFFAGAFGGLFTWLILDFLQKPIRGFFDLKKESIQVLTRYANVQARAKQVSLETERQILDLSHEQETRLREAEAALRDCGTKYHRIRANRNHCARAVALAWLCASGCWEQFHRAIEFDR